MAMAVTIGSGFSHGLDARKATVRKVLRFVGHEPFFQFILLGALIWGGVEYWNAEHNRYTIHLGSTERQRIVSNYVREFGQAPTPNQIQSLIDSYVREQIYFREGLALNLAQDDEIVLRRIVQKYEFVQSDLSIPETPQPAVLEHWFEQNKARYFTPESVAFSQVYFAVDMHGEEAARRRAFATLKTLRKRQLTRAPELGDAFPGPADVSAVNTEDARRLFGDSELSHALFKVPLQEWSGPYRSGYGWHLVYVSGHRAPVLSALSEVRERVLADYEDEQRRVLDQRLFAKLRAKYKVRNQAVGQTMPVAANIRSEPIEAD
jgi:peptidyl-prolyl cis-trans isomerase C